jgi:hypothetical protein
VPTIRLNEQVKRNPDRFPADFAFILTSQEVATMRSQFATASRRNVRHMPYAFTEHGAIMAANVLNSPDAIRMSVFVVRAFVRIKQALIGRAEIERRLLEVEKLLLNHDDKIRDLVDKIRPLLLPPPEPPKKIGFGVKEPRPRYGKHCAP